VAPTLGRLLTAQERPAEAEEALAKAAAIQDRHLPPDHPERQALAEARRELAGRRPAAGVAPP
jgi:hypothetical protein